MVESRFQQPEEIVVPSSKGEQVGPSSAEEARIKKFRVKETMKELYFPGKRIFNTSLFIVGLAFIANALLLYSDTLTTVFHADVFFGFSRQGRNDHLQRSAGILGFIVGFMNLYTASINKNRELTAYCLLADAISITHYLVETFWFRSIRYEYTALISVFLIINFIWAVRNYYYDLRMHHEKEMNVRGNVGNVTQSVHED